MKPSKLYSNNPELFAPIAFNEGLNVVLAEIRLPENRNRDTHNLGKTTVGRLLDFGFLAKRDSRFFLFRHPDTFDDFVFFLEIELADKSYVTVRRSVAESSRIAFKKHSVRHQDFSNVAVSEWDHLDVPFERARELLDSYLGLHFLKPWQFRKLLGYFLRGQDDYGDVFQLRRFAGAHSDWKPSLAHILGFDAKLTVEHYHKERQIEEETHRAETIRQELAGQTGDFGKIDGLILLKKKAAERTQAAIDAFDFRKLTWPKPATSSTIWIGRSPRSTTGGIFLWQTEKRSYPRCKRSRSCLIRTTRPRSLRRQVSCSWDRSRRISPS